MPSDLSLLAFWAKTRPSSEAAGAAAWGPDFHPLIYHLLDVAACAEALMRRAPLPLARIAAACNADPGALAPGFVKLIALHDIGKCARGFQGMVPELWPTFLGPKPGQTPSVRHDAAGVWLLSESDRLADIVETLLPDLFPSQRLTMIQAVCGHHGEPVEERSGGFYPNIGNPSRDIGSKAEDAAAAIAEALVALLGPGSCRIVETAVSSVSYWLAGLTVLADWLGSNRTWFAFQPMPSEGDLSSHLADYWQASAQPGAARALEESGILPASISSAKGLADLFDPSYRPTPLQLYAETVTLPDGPALFVIEDMTGAGKTEAATILAHRMMQDGKAEGLHVALPTMATANAMFGRLAVSYRRMFAEAERPSIVLTHGRRDLFPGFRHLTAAADDGGGISDDDDSSRIEAGAYCADWLARSNKQAFLAQVGAGTIDQAILSVLPARHQSLRLWGLASKVLVIDEAHAYDSYMNTEIERLLQFQAALGGSAIVLSATLPQSKRAALVNAFLKGLTGCRQETWQPSLDAYPLTTLAARGGVEERPLALREALAREVVIERIGSIDDAHARALDAASRGAAVALIRNTVDEAIASFCALSDDFEDVSLFHARFAMADRSRIEADVLSRFGKDGRERNAIVVATQVIEQSLDLDFDLVISDLAPVDLLIQRAGRLWRHQRARRPLASPRLLVLSPDPSDDPTGRWPAPVLPKTKFVYDNQAVMWRSAKAIFAAGRIVSRTSAGRADAQSGEIRALVEAAYDIESIALPPSLDHWQTNAEGKDYGERAQAEYKLLALDAGYRWDGLKWEKDTRVRTRLGADTITLRLARIEQDRIVPWAPIEDGDLRRAWTLSELSLRSSQCSGCDNPTELQALVDAERRRWTVSEREIPVVVLRRSNEGEAWIAHIRDRGGRPAEATYSADLGFRWAALS